ATRLPDRDPPNLQGVPCCLVVHLQMPASHSGFEAHPYGPPAVVEILRAAFPPRVDFMREDVECLLRVHRNLYGGSYSIGWWRLPGLFQRRDPFVFLRVGDGGFSA